jgi:hypothetical protein
MHPPTGTLSGFETSACALRNSIPLVGLFTGWATAEAASSEIKPASKRFIRKSFTRTRNVFCTTTALLEISIVECPKYEHLDRAPSR